MAPKCCAHAHLTFPGGEETTLVQIAQSFLDILGLHTVCYMHSEVLSGSHHPPKTCYYFSAKGEAIALGSKLSPFVVFLRRPLVTTWTTIAVKEVKLFVFYDRLL